MPKRSRLLFVLLTCRLALAQSSTGYVVAGIGAGGGKRYTQTALGGEFVIRRFIGVGGEIGAIAGHETSAVFSANGYYHLPIPAREKVDLT